MTPYRIAVFASAQVPISRRSKKLKTVSYGYLGWTARQEFDAGARLPGAGSFLFSGLRCVRAVRDYLALPETHQVQIRTNQDRTLYIYNKHSDGRITGYAPEQD